MKAPPTPIADSAPNLENATAAATANMQTAIANKTPIIRRVSANISNEPMAMRTASFVLRVFFYYKIKIFFFDNFYFFPLANRAKVGAYIGYRSVKIRLSGRGQVGNAYAYHALLKLLPAFRGYLRSPSGIRIPVETRF